MFCTRRQYRLFGATFRFNKYVKLRYDLTWNPANSRGTTFLQNISRAFGRVCSAMLRSPDERTLNPGTLETIEDSLDDLESHLSICSG